MISVPVLDVYDLVVLNLVGRLRGGKRKAVPKPAGTAPFATKDAADAHGGHAVGERHFSWQT
jgi:hypothetical protein